MERFASPAARALERLGPRHHSLESIQCALAAQTLLSVPDLGLPASAHVDVGNLDGVVAVAEAVPGWDLGLHVAGCVGRAGAERIPSRLGGLPLEGPVLPLVRTLWGLEVGRMPVAFTG